MILQPLEKIVLKFPVEKPRNGRVIGIKPELDQSISYIIEPRSSDFGPLHNGARVIRINSKDIGRAVKIERHISLNGFHPGFDSREGSNVAGQL